MNSLRLVEVRDVDFYTIHSAYLTLTFFAGLFALFPYSIIFWLISLLPSWEYYILLLIGAIHLLLVEVGDELRENDKITTIVALCPNQYKVRALANLSKPEQTAVNRNPREFRLMGTATKHVEIFTTSKIKYLHQQLLSFIISNNNSNSKGLNLKWQMKS